MTLHTRLAVTTAGVDAEAAFDLLLDLVGASADQRKLGRKTVNSSGTVDISMPAGLGLNALVWIEYQEDGSLIPFSSEETDDLEELKRIQAANDELEEQPNWSYEDYIDISYSPKRYIELHFDTAYGYRAPNGAGCGDLHAWIIQSIGEWLQAQGAEYSWYDESGWGWDEMRKLDEAKWIDRSDVSAQWGTLGDPDVGAPSSMIPSVTEDSRYDFLRTVLPAALLESAIRSIDTEEKS